VVLVSNKSEIWKQNSSYCCSYVRRVTLRKTRQIRTKEPTDYSDKRSTKVSANIPLRSKFVCRFPGLWNATSPNVAKVYRDSRRFWCHHHQLQCSPKRRDRPRKQQSTYERPSEMYPLYSRPTVCAVRTKDISRRADW